MLVLAPQTDFSNVSSEIVVTAYQVDSGLSNLVTPTSAILWGIGFRARIVEYLVEIHFASFSYDRITGDDYAYFGVAFS
jgi:uncharacterized ion transporter superfamily protein YfcC